MTIIYFVGTRLDHGDADAVSSVEADYLERLAARPPVVVRGYDEAGNPVSVIRAGERIDDAAIKRSDELTEYGFDPASIAWVWVFPVKDVYGNAVDAYSPQSWSGTSQLRPPPFSFRPHAALPMPNGHLFCLADRLPNTFELPRSPGSVSPNLYREYYRVYRRNGDWVKDFPADLHGAPIHDAVWDDSGNCFLAGDEVGAERYSFRKYNSAYALQWSVSFKDYWPKSTIPVRIDAQSFEFSRAQFNQRWASVKIEIAPDGSLYVISQMTLTRGYERSGYTTMLRYYRRETRFMQISRVSAAGALLWTRVLQRYQPGSFYDRPEPDRKGFSCRALDSGQLVVFFESAPPVRYSVGEVGGDYVWDYSAQVIIYDNQWTDQLRQDAVADLIDWQNGLVVNSDGSMDGHLFPYTEVFVNAGWIYPNTLIHSVMRYADERLVVFSQRVRYGNTAAAAYNIDPKFVKHVFYKDLTLLSETEIAGFDYTDAVAVAEDGSTYHGRRAIKRYEYAYRRLEFSFQPGAPYSYSLICAMHFRSTDAAGDPLWDELTATARLGINTYGKEWRDYGNSRTIQSGQTLENWHAAHDNFVAQITPHGATASGDLLAVVAWQTTALNFWLPATDIAIVYNSVTPALALPVFLGRPTLIGPVTTHAPGLPLELALRVPVLRREYVGPLLPEIYRLTLGDLEIPFSVLTVRKAGFEVTVSAVCPAASEPLVAALIARDTETLTVWRGVRFRDGREQLEVLLATPLTGLRYDRGANSGSITLDGRYIPDVPARARAVVGLERIETRGGLRVWSSPLPDIFLNPGDTVVLGSESFTAGQVEYQISPNAARMTVREAGG